MINKNYSIDQLKDYARLLLACYSKENAVKVLYLEKRLFASYKGFVLSLIKEA